MGTDKLTQVIYKLINTKLKKLTPGVGKTHIEGINTNPKLKESSTIIQYRKSFVSFFDSLEIKIKSRFINIISSQPTEILFLTVHLIMLKDLRSEHLPFGDMRYDPFENVSSLLPNCFAFPFA